MIRKLLLALVAGVLAWWAQGQALRAVQLSSSGRVETLQCGSSTVAVDRDLLVFASKPAGSVKWEVVAQNCTHSWCEVRVRFLNIGSDTARLSNVVPLQPGPAEVYMTGKGDHRLSRTHLFRPGKIPLNVIVPDNAWEMGFCFVPLMRDSGLYGLARRDAGSIRNGLRKRFETILAPGGAVDYLVYLEVTASAWQGALITAFRDRKLFDLARFDSTLYHRADLTWIRTSAVMHLFMAWDKDVYDPVSQRYTLTDFVRRGKRLYGGDDAVGLWPTWPALGLDQRNQFDLYRDLPGGLPAIRQLADSLRALGTRLFIAYNPWDESTRREDHLQGLSDLIAATTADGVVLDTRGESSAALQAAADRVRPGVIMYSEGMAVPKDMPGIVAGRVHNALYYPPPLNLNRLIQPGFSIFRVAEVFKEPIRREFAVAFLNGYGTEINQFAPGHPEWEDEQYRFLGRTSRILREHAPVFRGGLWEPLVEVGRDSVYVNRFSSGSKTLYTLLSFKPEGVRALPIPVAAAASCRWVDLWNHEELNVATSSQGTIVKVDLEPFPAARLGTNDEGAVGCIASLPMLLEATRSGDRLTVAARGGDTIRIWAGMPAYDQTPLALRAGDTTVSLRSHFGRFEGKWVIQLMESGELLDERVLVTKPGEPRLISAPEKTGSRPPHSGMVRIPAGRFVHTTSQGDMFIPYPAESRQEVTLPAFWMDVFPVTNRRFFEFIRATGYHPRDTANFLRHWRQGHPRKGEEDHPVVYVSYEDAQAYARWVGKRLPTEVEWQYAAQSDERREWPWVQKEPVVRSQRHITETRTATQLTGLGKNRCNPGNGILDPVGRYPAGKSKWGLFDLTGSVWQLTHDVYESGSYQFVILKGGSYFHAGSSGWYVQGGPRELHYRQMLLRVAPGFERNATVGFRCMQDE